MKRSTIKNQEKAHEYVEILGVKISSNSKDELLTAIEYKLTKKIQFYIVTPNPEIILQAQSDLGLSHSLNLADISIPDGVGLKFAIPSLHIIKGRELFVDLLKIANKKRLKVYLLGGRDFVNKKALDILALRYPYVKLSGNAGPRLDSHAEPVSKVDISLQSDIFKEINTFKPDLLFVAFGAPKQEIWINKWLLKLKVIGAMAVGGSLDYYAGVVKPLPKFLEKRGLEWLWRIIQEPWRFPRIFNALVIFPIKVIFDGREPKNQDQIL